MTQPYQKPFDRPEPKAVRTHRYAWITAAMAMMLVTATGGAAAQSAIEVIPLPRVIRPAAGTFILTPDMKIFVNSPELADVGRYLSEMLAPATGMQLAVGPLPAAATRGIVLALDRDRGDLGQEGYALNCTPEALTITAARPAGVFYGVQTLRQLLPSQIESRQPAAKVTWAVPCVAIQDSPRFAWRGLLLDPARHFRTKEELMRYIDLLALHKLNILHVHLTDDQGWRIEIGKYPKLTETGSRLPDCSGQRGDNRFYSRADMKEIVEFAASRHVTVVPEIEMPGHSGAATTSYPELGCGGQPSGQLCVSREGTFEFARNVLDEVMEMFPSPYIHVGADEVSPDRWRACPTCKPLMEKLAGEALPEDVSRFRVKVTSGAGRPFCEDVARLQGEFVRRIDRYLASKGRRMVGWDEILDGGLRSNSRAMVMAWRNAEVVAGAAGQGRDVVFSPYPEYYLDNGHALQGTYACDPLPANLPTGQESHIFGVQGNMWGEQTPTIRRVDEQTFPRLCAIAEIGWTCREGRNFEDFSRRLTSFRQRLDLLGVNGRKPAGQPSK